MSLAAEDQPTLPESIYIAPDVEWQSLLSLAGASNPGELIESEQWSEALFASEDAQARFQELAQSNISISLQVPPSLDGVVAFSDPAARQNARRILTAFAQFRRLETIQTNLARETRRLASTRRIDGIGQLLE